MQYLRRVPCRVRVVCRVSSVECQVSCVVRPVACLRTISNTIPVSLQAGLRLDIFFPCERHTRARRSASAAYAHCTANLYVKDHHRT